MDPLDDYVDFYLKKLKCRDFDAAFHGLTEADSTVIPKLTDIFHREYSPDIRGELIKIIWQYRQPSTIPLLSEALSDPNFEVWQNALDGLVAIASPDALPILEAALTRTLATKEKTDTFRKWIMEAVDQLMMNIAKARC